MAAPKPLEILLQQLCSGDSQAAQRVFVAYEPLLRMVVRRQLTPALRAKFDSIDIVQSIWGDLLTGFKDGCWEFTSPEQLHVFLVKATRNRFIDRVRQHQTAMRLQQALEMNDLQALPQSRPAQAGAQLEAEEMWERLVALCPVQHRGLLELKRQGLTLAEISVRTGLHKGSIRRILYELAAKLAAS